MKKSVTASVAAALLLIAWIAPAAAYHNERWYVRLWCQQMNGQEEYMLPDQTYCDCLTETHAVEVDFAKSRHGALKWYEGLGQALHYANMTGKKPGVVLIVNEDEHMKYCENLVRIIEEFDLPVDAWWVNGEGVTIGRYPPEP